MKTYEVTVITDYGTLVVPVEFYEGAEEDELLDRAADIVAISLSWAKVSEVRVV